LIDSSNIVAALVAATRAATDGWFLNGPVFYKKKEKYKNISNTNCNLFSV